MQKVKGSFFADVNLRNDCLGIFPNQGKLVRVFDENNLTSFVFCVHFNHVLADLYFSSLRLFCLNQIISFR